MGVVTPIRREAFLRVRFRVDFAKSGRIGIIGELHGYKDRPDGFTM